MKLWKKSNNMFVTPQNHTRQNFKYELEESFWFRAIETKKLACVQKLLEKIYYFLM
jgi:hypothetical protein